MDTLEQRCGCRHGPMHDQRTGRAMSRQNRRGGVLRHSLAKAHNPILAMGCIPLALDYSLARRIMPLPVALPVVGPGVAEPREYQSRDFVIHMPGQVVSTEPQELSCPADRAISRQCSTGDQCAVAEDRRRIVRRSPCVPYAAAVAQVCHGLAGDSRSYHSPQSSIAADSVTSPDVRRGAQVRPTIPHPAAR